MLRQNTGTCGLSSTGTINQSNVIGAPKFGAATWLNPINFVVYSINDNQIDILPIYNIYFNSTDKKFYLSDGTNWNYLRDATNHDRIILLDNPNQSIFEYDNGFFIITDNPIYENSAVILENDGLGDVVELVYNDETLSQENIADSAFIRHLNGGANKHKSTEIGIVSELINIDYTSGENLDNALQDIDTTVGMIENRLDIVESAAPKTFHHIQAIANNTQYIEHNLNKWPDAVIFDSSMDNERIYGDIKYLDNNRITIEFSQPLTGQVYLS